MIPAIQLHLGLIKFILKEVRKRKSLKEFITFFKSVIKIYLKELFKLYKNLFLFLDVDYQKQKKQYEQYKKIQTDLQRCIKILQYMDERMEKAGINRQRRRQFWRDFYRDGQVRKEVFDDLIKEINQIK
jgi:methionine salvage enolase-phosphatase E1